MTSIEVLIYVLAFAIQIYGDFSGYSNIARGLAKFFGVELMVNFRQPYLSRNPSDFWQRWHISLSSWFRDYLYMPLGGNRKGIFYTCRNLTITMFLAGLWHGAAWNFVLWGVYQGVLLAGYHGLSLMVPLHKFKSMVMDVLSRIFMFLLVLYGWLIFRVKDMAQLKYLTVQLFPNFHLPNERFLDTFKINTFWVVLFFLITLAVTLFWKGIRADVFLIFINFRIIYGLF